MANFVLVHGAWCGGWIWERCASLLRAEGHQVYMPTRTGLGERSHLISSSINLSTHIQDVLNLIKFEQLTDVLLCGHSYGGMIITAVADAIPEKSYPSSISMPSCQVMVTAWQALPVR
ncbi:alpha/beta hydrolase [Neorhizobium sp. P12A]|uniref:alpha/beta fold hydrolase n=1 Tax=Neorhizobium sp. P12A TaxID=2268027 RepID=UPI001AED12D1|nr:alpha/beta hydrolase [Neorhizobium sp. P12A]